MRWQIWSEPNCRLKEWMKLNQKKSLWKIEKVTTTGTPFLWAAMYTVGICTAIRLLVWTKVNDRFLDKRKFVVDTPEVTWPGPHSPKFRLNSARVTTNLVNSPTSRWQIHWSCLPTRSPSNRANTLGQGSFKESTRRRRMAYLGI